MRDFHLPGRSVVHATNGAAATSHPLATLTAIDVLRAGGNAADAAVAACAVHCVVEPMMTGIGGDCFVLLQKGGQGPVTGLNGSGRAPAGLSAEYLLERGIDRIGLESVHSITVPGAVDAWCRLVGDHGTKGLDELFRPAIRYAEEGFAVAPRTSADWARNAPRLAGDPNAARLYLKDGQAPPAGGTWRSPELGATLGAIGERGRAAFYDGEIAEDMVGYLREIGGTHTLDDFAGHASDYVEPIMAPYAGRDVVELPPNGQGIVALMILKILAGYDLSALDPVGADRVHLETEAARLAYAARNRFVADPEHVDVPVDHLLSDALADELRGRISMDRAAEGVPDIPQPPHRDTIYLTVVDRDLNCVSFINSLFHGFGSCIASPNSGVMFQNRGAGFAVQPGHPNCVAPGKRPLHTIIPGMALRDGNCEISFGVMGGAFQPVGHAHLLTNMWDYGMDVQEAIDCPRAFHFQGELTIERGIPESVRRDLAARGHRLREIEIPWGGAQAIVIDRQAGTLAAGSDPRKDGCALGY
jgi:gamma-glutamyltranspeptidase/glutathione hydrolase